VKKIYLIRHGRQDSRLCNLDVPLSAEGREQADLLGKRLEVYGIEKIYSSHLVRAVETAQVINKHLHLDHEVLQGIHEIDFGGFTGKTEEEICHLYGDYRRERSLHREDLAYPEGGESGADVVARAFPVLKKICQGQEESLAVVTHGGVIRSLCAHILGTDQRHKLKFGIDLENCSLTEVVYDKERDFFFLERFNDYGHLESKPELLRGAWKTSLEKLDK